MKIVAESSSLFTQKEAKKFGIEVLPLKVAIGDETWSEGSEISTDEFLKKIADGGMPTSSCPAPADVIRAYEGEEEILHLSMADGLSGTYEVASSLAAQAKNPDRVTVVNTTTLCGPLRAIVAYAIALNKENKSKAEILDCLKPLMESSFSYLIPADFDFLKRGGRLTPMAAKFVSVLKVVPVMVQTLDGRRIERSSIGRNLSSSIKKVISDMKKRSVDARSLVTISHAQDYSKARAIADMIRSAFPEIRIEIFELTPSFIVQGGPGCIAIQTVDIAGCPNIALAK